MPAINAAIALLSRPPETPITQPYAFPRPAFLMASTNAARRAGDSEGVVFDRAESYTGVLIDDLVIEGLTPDETPFLRARSIAVLKAAAEAYGWDARPSPRPRESGTILTGRGAERAAHGSALGPADLAAGLNDLLGAGTYDYIDTGVIGTDAIRVGLNVAYSPRGAPGAPGRV